MPSQQIVQVLVPATLAVSPGMLHYEIVNGPPEGTATWTREYDDGAGLADLVATVAAYASTSADSLGVSDALSTVAAYSLTITDSAGRTDTATRFVSPAVTNDRGLVDTTAFAVTMVLTPADIRGLVDTVVTSTNGLAQSDDTGRSDLALTAAVYSLTTGNDGTGLVDDVSTVIF